MTDSEAGPPTETPSIPASNLDTSGYRNLLWIWLCAVAIAVGVIFGNLFPRHNELGEPQFSAGAFFAGAIVGTIATFPVWALYGVLRTLLFNLYWLRRELADAREGSSASN